MKSSVEFSTATSCWCSKFSDSGTLWISDFCTGDVQHVLKTQEGTEVPITNTNFTSVRVGLPHRESKFSSSSYCFWSCCLAVGSCCCMEHILKRPWLLPSTWAEGHSLFCSFPESSPCCYCGKPVAWHWLDASVECSVAWITNKMALLPQMSLIKWSKCLDFSWFISIKFSQNLSSLYIYLLLKRQEYLGWTN